MQVYKDPVQVKPKDSGYTISIAVSDSILVIKTLTKRDLLKLKFDIEQLINEEE